MFKQWCNNILDSHVYLSAFFFQTETIFHGLKLNLYCSRGCEIRNENHEHEFPALKCKFYSKLKRMGTERDLKKITSSMEFTANDTFLIILKLTYEV